MSYLKLCLSGKMQYYCPETLLVMSSSGGFFRTERHPTRKAITGLLGAAFGYERGDKHLDDFRESLDMKYRTVKSGNVIVDFNTVAPLYDDVYFKNVEGGFMKGNTGRVIKKIEYLTNYEFEVYIGGDKEKLKEIYDHIVRPYWPLYIGKKVCLPAKPIVEEFEILDQLPADVYDI